MATKWPPSLLSCSMQTRPTGNCICIRFFFTGHTDCHQNSSSKCSFVQILLKEDSVINKCSVPNVLYFFRQVARISTIFVDPEISSCTSTSKTGCSMQINLSSARESGSKVENATIWMQLSLSGVSKACTLKIVPILSVRSFMALSST